MSGLVKAKKFDWKDSNLALFGSDTEKNVSFNFKMAAVPPMDCICIEWWIFRCLPANIMY